MGLLAQDLQRELAIKNSIWNFGKSVAVFGGSVSGIPAVKTAKDMLERTLRNEYYYLWEFGGAPGFSSLAG